MEYFLRAIPNDFNTKNYYLLKNKDNIEVLILGSSHTFVGVDPNVLNKTAFNMAYSTQTLDLDEKILDKYKNSLPNLKTLIIPVSYFSYVFALEDGLTSKKIKNYNIYYRLYSHTFKFNHQLEVLSNPFNISIEHLKKAYQNPTKYITIDTLGYIKNRYKQPNLDWEKSAFHALNNHTKNLEDNIVKRRIIENTTSLENIIFWCYNNNIKVLLVSTPTTALYVQNANQVQLTHWSTSTAAIAKKYPNVIWINYLQNNNDFDLNDFQNADHLSEIGARKLSLKLNQFL